MNPLSSPGRTGAVAAIDGASPLSGTSRSGGATFGQSLQYVIDTGAAARQRFDGGNDLQTGNPVDRQSGFRNRYPAGGNHGGGLRGGYGVSPLHTGVRISDQPVVAALSAPMGDTNDAGNLGVEASARTLKPLDNGIRDVNTQPVQGANEPQQLKRDGYGYDTPGGYQFEYVPSTLDPGSMAFLLALLGGGGPQVGGQSIQQQQQSYLDGYRQRFPNGVPGVKNYITATTRYLGRTT